MVVAGAVLLLAAALPGGALPAGADEGPAPSRAEIERRLDSPVAWERLDAERTVMGLEAQALPWARDWVRAREPGRRAAGRMGRPAEAP